jgi:hypothetical protein
MSVWLLSPSRSFDGKHFMCTVRYIKGNSLGVKFLIGVDGEQRQETNVVKGTETDIPQEDDDWRASKRNSEISSVRFQHYILCDIMKGFERED